MDILNDIELDDAVKQQIAERFSAQIEEATTGLKSKVDELLSEKKREQSQRKAAEEAARKEAEEKAKAENDYKQLFESQKSEADSLREQMEKMQKDAQNLRIFNEATKIASSLTKDTGRADILTEKLSQRLTLVDGEIRVTDAKGQLTVSSLQELSSSIQESYPFLIDGSQASGGGATKSQASGERPKEISRNQFDGMNHADRASFFKSGGKVIDD